MKIKNVNGSSKISGTPPKGHSSWLNYWENISEISLDPEKSYQCPACKIPHKKEQFHGCHVQKELTLFDNKWYIIPLCNKCNQSTSVMEVNGDLLIPVPSNL